MPCLVLLFKVGEELVLLGYGLLEEFELLLKRGVVGGAEYLLL